MSKKNFYITTAIDYPNGAPHMGHAYEKIITDAYARWARSSGLETYFLTGTDENGQKLAKSAEELNVPTRKFVDDNAEIFKKLCSELKISNDDFIRTTESRHSKVVGEFWRKLEKNGDVYFDRYSGLYCLACETFYTETQASDRLCPEHKTKLELLEEEGYFFKMSKYEKWIKEFLTGNPAFVAPSEARNEIVSRLNSEPLKDLSISRPNKGWGIPVPGNDKFVVYTWFDALINYYSAVVGTSHENYWPADLHVIGKDIGWFHTVIWPIMLHALGIPTPAQVYIHGMVLSEDGRKMSKSLGNGVDPFDVLKTYPLDSFRYFMLRSIPSGGNGRFSMKDLNQRHVSELGNDFGNLLMRIVKLARKRLGDQVAPVNLVANTNVNFDFEKVHLEMDRLMSAREHNRALDVLWSDLNKVNAYVNASTPWAIKDGDPQFQAVVHQTLQALYCASILLAPFMPHTSAEALRSLGFKDEDFSKINRKNVSSLTFQLSDPPVLFPRVA